MKKLFKFSRFAAVSCLTGSVLAETGSGPAAPSVSVGTGNGVVTLNRSGGRGSYQLQRRMSLGEAWQNVGQPTSASSATVPVTEGSLFFRVVGDYTARFEVVFDSTWSADTHRGARPPKAHWSGPVGGVHNDKVRFWQEGETASEGIRLMAERGQQGTLAAEIQAAIPAGNASFTMTSSGLGSPAQRVITFPQATTRDFPLLTLCSMVRATPTGSWELPG